MRTECNERSLYVNDQHGPGDYDTADRQPDGMRGDGERDLQRSGERHRTDVSMEEERSRHRRSYREQLRNRDSIDSSCGHVHGPGERHVCSERNQHGFGAECTSSARWHEYIDNGYLQRCRHQCRSAVGD